MNGPVSKAPAILLFSLLAAALGSFVVHRHSLRWRSYRGPIVDGHVHVFPGGAGERAAFADALAGAMDRAGVSRAVLGLNAKHVEELDIGPPFDEIHDDWVLEACSRHPGRFYPSLAGFDPGAPGSEAYVRRRLQSGPWKAVGELDLRNRAKEQHIPADSPALMRIYRLAARERLPVMIHYDVDYGTDAASGTRELERAISGNPDTVFILAHRVDEALMNRFSNVWGDFGSRPSRKSPRTTRSLRDIFEENPRLIDRIIIAIDIAFQPHARRPWGWRGEISLYGSKVEGLRRALGELPPEAAEKVAHGNLEGLLSPRPSAPQ